MMVKQAVTRGVISLLSVSLLAGCGAQPAAPTGNTGVPVPGESKTGYVAASTVSSAVSSGTSSVTSAVSLSAATRPSSFATSAAGKTATSDGNEERPKLPWFSTEKEGTLVSYRTEAEGGYGEDGRKALSPETLKEIQELLQQEGTETGAVKGIPEYAVIVEGKSYFFNISNGWFNLASGGVQGLKFSRETAEKLDALLKK